MVYEELNNSIECLKKELEDEELTLKGFIKNFKKVMVPHLDSKEYKELVDLDAQLMEEEITEKGYMAKSRKLLEAYLIRLNSIKNTSTIESTKNKENDQNISNDGINGHLDSLQCANTMLGKTESTQNGTCDNVPVLEEEVMETCVVDKNQEEINNKIRGKVNVKSIRKKKADLDSQPSITSMFSTSVSPMKRRSQSLPRNEEIVIDDDIPDSKRIKVNGNHNSDAEMSDVLKIENPSKYETKLKPIPKKCKICHQLLNEHLKLYAGHPDKSAVESVALVDQKLLLFTGEEEAIFEGDELPVTKLTGFSFYDREGHLVPFDGDAIERDEYIYASGYLKPVYDEDSSIENGVPVNDVGPINMWSIAGFDGGEKALLMISTSYGEYYLVEPSEAYSSFFNAVLDKCYMIKVVIEFISNSVDPQFEDLINKLQTTVPPPGISSFTEETLLRHAQFVCDQVHSYDLATSSDDDLLMPTPCMMTLKDLAGVTLSKRKTESKIKVQKMPKFTKATTTPLVQNLFENFFSGQLDTTNASIQAPKKTRCNVCEVCLAKDCGNCNSCKDMIKFGGTGKSKQCCVLRKCPNLALAEALDDQDEGLEEKMNTIHLDSKPKIVHTTTSRKRLSQISWASDPIAKEDSKVFYSSVLLEDNGKKTVISVGDCVSVQNSVPGEDSYLARVTALWENKALQKSFHGHWFCRSKDSIIGETSDPQELFVMDDCEDMSIHNILQKENIVKFEVPKNWHQLGGSSDLDLYSPLPTGDTKSFFYQKWYCPEFARFEDIPKEISKEGLQNHLNCQSCYRLDEKKKFNLVQLGKKLENNSTEKSKGQCYENVQFRGYEYNIGDCVFVESGSFNFPAFEAQQNDSKIAPTDKKKSVDENLYPEYYRKTSKGIKGSNQETPEPFRVARIIKISSKTSGSEALPEDVKIVAAKFYRPENTHRGIAASYQSDFNLLYWSEEVVFLNFNDVTGKCWVVYKGNLREKLDDFTRAGPYRFFFTEAYNGKKKSFEELPSAAQTYGAVGKTNRNINTPDVSMLFLTPLSNHSFDKGVGNDIETSRGKGKGKSNSKGTDKPKKSAPMDTYPNVSRKLRTLDVFSGCGGLSEGFHQAGLAESRWAIEVFEPAARAFRLNHPSSTVFTDDCNLLLKLAMEGEEKNALGQKIPQKGEVELLCGGPPCQGFSGMNRFNSRQYSQFKNSLVSSYLSYCDFYRPKFFLLENVRNFVSYKCSMVLKLTLRVLIKMGYQCTVGILQAGNFGVAQTRRRAIILAAAPGEKLPYYPEPLTSFNSRACSLTLTVDDKKFMNNCQWLYTAPYRTVTVRDAMSDLPEIRNGANKDQINYGTEPESHFQRLIRGSQFQPVLMDHICKDMALLVVERMRHVPTAPGSDWRDLPNISVKFGKSGELTKVLIYTHHDSKNGRSSTGALRGVCSCVTAKNSCDPMDKQYDTLIPWCLPHTGNRHNNWAGLYGRLEWDGFFSTTVTNPEPMGKQGRVLHPEQHRVVSVRECARSQGFPDTYRFYGSILEKHRQVGNAVPPPMAKAIACEIAKCVQAREHELYNGNLPSSSQINDIKDEIDTKVSLKNEGSPNGNEAGLDFSMRRPISSTKEVASSSSSSSTKDENSNSTKIMNGSYSGNVTEDLMEVE